MNNGFINRAGKKLTVQLHEGQTKAWDADQRFVFILAGTQSGKTTFGPWWLKREIDRKGDGDYIAVSATYDLFKLKMLPEMLQVFGGYFPGWEYHKTDRVIYNGNKRIILRAATSEAGLESATAKAAWLDECGQDDFGIGAWEAVLRRLSLEQGRVLGTTTIYNLGWLYSQVYQRWLAGDKDYYIVQFDSTMNPSFPKEEYLRAERTMPRWKFEMQYRGNFSRPAGQIYDCFDPKEDVIPPFQIPPYFRRYGGVDFGGVHTAGLCYAENPDSGQLYLIKEYLEGEKSTQEHADDFIKWGCRLWVGGAASEDQWRLEFRKAGLPIAAPIITEVEVGIDRVYATHKKKGILVFDTCAKYLDEKGRYTRELDDFGQPTSKIKDKSKFHLMDAERYIIGYIRGEKSEAPDEQPEQPSKWAKEENKVEEGKSRWRY
jgi:hypothetical protein